MSYDELMSKQNNIGGGDYDGLFLIGDWRIDEEILQAMSLDGRTTFTASRIGQIKACLVEQQYRMAWRWIRGSLSIVGRTIRDYIAVLNEQRPTRYLDRDEEHVRRCLGYKS